MAEELYEYEEQLREIINNVETCLLNEVSKLNGAARIEKCEYLKNRINRARQLVKSINVEMRELPADKRSPWIEKVKSFESQIAKFQQDINWAITSAERGNNTDARFKGVDDMTSKDLTTAGLAIQNQSLQSTTRTKAAIAATIQIGTETMDVLKQQTDQIKGIDENLDQIESNLKRADKQLRAFLRRMATDKIVMVLIFLIVLGIVGAIIATVKFGSKTLADVVSSSVASVQGSNLVVVSKSINGVFVAQ